MALPKLVSTKRSLPLLLILAIGCGKAEVAKMAFVTQPASSYTGDPLGTVTVQLLDSGGKPIVDGTSAVTVSVSSGTLGGTTTVAATGGVATFGDLHVDSAATGLMLTATVDKVTAQSQPFSVTALQLKFDAEPGSFVAPKSKLSVAVHLTDVNGGEVPLVHRTVSIKLGTSSGVTLTGTPSQDVTSGVATFSDLSVDIPVSSLMLVASTNGAPDVTSDGFSVTYSRDEIEPLNKAAPNAVLNDTHQTAESLALGIPLFGTLAAANDVDYYKFTATVGQLLNVSLFANRLDQAHWDTGLHVTLYGSDGVTALYRNGAGEITAPNSADFGLQEVQIPSSGTYYLALSVDGAGVTVGKYGMIATLSLPTSLQRESEAVGATGDNDTRADAQLLNPGTLIGYWAGGASPGVDYYAINVSGPSRVHAQMTAERNGYYAAEGGHYDPEIYLSDSSGTLSSGTGTVLWDNDDTLFYDSGLDYLLATAGEYYIRVDVCCGTGAAPYFLEYDVTPISTTVEALPNATFPNATVIAYGGYVSGNNTAGESHYFKFVGKAGDMVRVRPFDADTQNGTTTTLSTTLIATDGVTLLTQASNFQDYNVTQSILQADGTYFVKVVGSGAGSFVFNLERVNPAAYETEPNGAPITAGTTPQASAFDGNGRAAGVIGQAADLDNYVFQAGSGELVSVSLYGAVGRTNKEPYFSSWGSSITPQLQIYDASGVAQATSVFNLAGHANPESLARPLPMLEVSFRAPAPGNYYAVVSDKTGTGDASHFYVLELHRSE